MTLPLPQACAEIQQLAEAWVEAATCAAHDYPDHRIPRNLFPAAKAFTAALTALTERNAELAGLVAEAKEALSECAKPFNAESRDWPDIVSDWADELKRRQNIAATVHGKLQAPGGGE